MQFINYAYIRMRRLNFLVRRAAIALQSKQFSSLNVLAKINQNHSLYPREINYVNVVGRIIQSTVDRRLHGAPYRSPQYVRLVIVRRVVAEHFV